MWKSFYSVLILFIFYSCNEGSNIEEEKKSIATAYDNVLYLEDVLDELPSDLKGKDSVAYLELIISDWMRRQVLIYNAYEKVKERDEIERKVKNFREDLMIHSFQIQTLSEQMDTIVTDSEIRSYYKNHTEEFTLNDYLVKVLYIQLPMGVPQLNEIESKYKLYNESDLSFIEQHARQYALNYYYDIDTWIYFEELTKEIPLKLYSKESFILKKSATKIEDGDVLHFLNIIDYKLKDALSPLEFEKENIKNRIINKRILRFKKEIEDKLLEDAYSKNEIQRL